MTAQTVRRLYIYLAAFIGLQMLAAGAGGLCAFVGERWLGAAPLGDPGGAALRMASSVALVAVGLPLWGAHWAMARRDALAPEGQRSALRRLYAYAVLLVAALGAMTGLQSGLALALEGLGRGVGSVAPVAPLCGAAVSAAVWLAHWPVFAADRDLVERSGACATLRRWYLALALWASLGMLSFGAGVLIHGLLQRYAFDAPGSARQLAAPAAALVSGLALWLPHELWSRRLVRAPGPLRADELGSTLRQVFVAMVVASSTVAALAGLTALLAAALRAALGEATWAGAFAEETRAAAALAVGLPILFYEREQLVLTARLSGAEGRAGTARRLISYLVAAVSLVALYAGLGGLLGTLLRLWLGEWAVGDAWRTPLSWYVATTAVALPVFVTVARRSEGLARGSAEEERALSRRIYLYAALLFGVVAGVVMGTRLVQLLVVAALGEAGASAAGEVGRLLGYTALGLAMAAAHGALLRRAGAARGAAGAGRTVALAAGGALGQSLEAALAHELPGATVVTLGGADSPERRAALAGADLLILPLAALGDPALAGFAGARLVLATPLEGATLVGARREGPALAREAARAARGLFGPAPQAPPPAPAGGLAHGPA